MKPSWNWNVTMVVLGTILSLVVLSSGDSADAASLRLIGTIFVFGTIMVFIQVTQNKTNNLAVRMDRMQKQFEVATEALWLRDLQVFAAASDSCVCVCRGEMPANVKVLKPFGAPLMSVWHGKELYNVISISFALIMRLEEINGNTVALSEELPIGPGDLLVVKAFHPNRTREITRQFPTLRDYGFTVEIVAARTSF